MKPKWLTEKVVPLAKAAADDPSVCGILADCLEEDGCTDTWMVAALRDEDVINQLCCVWWLTNYPSRFPNAQSVARDLMMPTYAREEMQEIPDPLRVLDFLQKSARIRYVKEAK